MLNPIPAMLTRATACLAAMLIGAAVLPSQAMTLGAGKTGRLNLSGPVEPGDTDKLVSWLLEQRIPPSTIEINSSGGSVVEAIRVAELVSKLSLSVSVAPRGTCASACALIFFAGVGRVASPSELSAPEQMAKYGRSANLPGPVGLHRPYRAIATAPDDGQARIMRAVTGYLDGQLVPRRLVDVMMSRPSNDVYWLTERDLQELGEYPPAVEEFLISRCNYDRTRLVKIADGAGDVRALMDGHTRAMECAGAATASLSERGMQALKAGWRPARYDR